MIIHRLAIESSQNCGDDRVQLFDGDTDTPLSDPLCGQEPPSETFTSSSSVFIVQFQSDHSGADAGFVLRYSVVGGERDEVVVDENTGDSGHRAGS